MLFGVVSCWLNYESVSFGRSGVVHPSALIHCFMYHYILNMITFISVPSLYITIQYMCAFTVHVHVFYKMFIVVYNYIHESDKNYYPLIYMH